MTTHAIEHVTTLTTLDCGVTGCGIAFAIPTSLYRKASDDHGVWFWCPNGHHIHFTGESDRKRAERERDAARQIAQDERRARQRAEERERTADYRRRAAKAQLTKTRNRIANGVCPCCQRSFVNLAQHMAGEHPDYAVPTE